MEIMEIIKEAMVFPSKGLSKLAIYIVIAFIVSILGLLGFVFLGIGLSESAIFAVIGIILIIVALLAALVMGGYQISIIKSGIDGDEDLPEFVWKENFLTGVNYLVVSIVYFIIPAIFVLVVGWITNVFGLSVEVFNKMMYASINASPNTTVAVGNVVPQSTLIGLGNAMIITGLVAAILFLIFAFIQTVAGARLANTGRLGDALNISETIEDIGKIGWGKVIAIVILIAVIIGVINAIISGLNYYVQGISIVSVVVTPYLSFFAARATGLLYSDIA